MKKPARPAAPTTFADGLPTDADRGISWPAGRRHGRDEPKPSDVGFTVDGMTEPATPKATFHRYLTMQREQLLAKLDGLSEYDMRRPMTATGTNLLGIVKHVASVQLGYLGEVFGRSSDRRLPWFDDDAEVNADMWATADEATESVFEPYRYSCDHADATIQALDIDAVGEVSWWPQENPPGGRRALRRGLGRHRNSRNTRNPHCGQGVPGVGAATPAPSILPLIRGMFTDETTAPHRHRRVDHRLHRRCGGVRRRRAALGGPSRTERVRNRNTSINRFYGHDLDRYSVSA